MILDTSVVTMRVYRKSKLLSPNLMKPNITMAFHDFLGQNILIIAFSFDSQFLRTSRNSLPNKIYCS